MILKRQKVSILIILIQSKNHKELIEKQLDLEVLYYKIMRADELEKTIFKHETWTHNDKVAFAFSKWICILVKTLQ